MQKGDEQAYLARQLLAGAFQGVISTHSLDHPGYPFGSVVPYVIAGDGCPLMLLSHLSQHTKNIEADGRCGLTVMQQGVGDVQQLSRLSAIGDISAAGPGADAERYFAYFPQTRMYFDQLGFRFYRFTAARMHWNGGFATARWFAANRIVRSNPLDPESQRRVIEHMNQDHADTLRFYLRETLPLDHDEAVVMAGIDADGMDLRVGERLIRVPLPRTIGTAEDARQVLVEMANPPDHGSTS